MVEVVSQVATWVGRPAREAVEAVTQAAVTARARQAATLAGARVADLRVAVRAGMVEVWVATMVAREAAVELQAVAMTAEAAWVAKWAAVTRALAEE